MKNIIASFTGLPCFLVCIYWLQQKQKSERTTMQIDEHIMLASFMLPRYGWTTPWVSNKMGVGEMGPNRLDYPFHGLQSRFFEEE